MTYFDIAILVID